MGAKLLKYYEIVQEKAGVQGKMRLAMKTGIPSTKAGDAPDSPDNLKKFYDAAAEICGPVPRL